MFFCGFFRLCNRYHCVLVGGESHLLGEARNLISSSSLHVVVGLEVAGPSFTEGLLFPEFIFERFTLPETTIAPENG